MCSGPDSTKRRLTPPGFSMENGFPKQKEENPSSTSSILLEFSASDDVGSFKQAVESNGLALDESSLWYGRRLGSRKLGLEDRTPLMIAALYGSVEVLKYILSVGSVDVNRAAGSDGVTALHCAAAGGATSAQEVVRLLLSSAASVDSVDASDRRPADLIPSAVPSVKPNIPALELLLKRSSRSCSSFQYESGMEGNQTSEPQPLDCKKEYPIDQSLPDIKNGIYGTDEFRMYNFKVKPCSRAYSHDWTECPFVHPGENARRRDPRKYHYSCVPCPEFRKGTCRQGDACEYAHGVFECWLHPAQYRTRLCKDETGCTRRVCFFAHKPEELRPLYPSTGSAIPSPRSMSSASPDAITVGSPSGMSSGMWQNSLTPPVLQLPGSRLRSSFNARDLGFDFDFDFDMVGMCKDELSQLPELSKLSGASALTAAAALSGSGSRSGKFNSIAPTNLDEFFGSIDSPSALSQLQAMKSAQFQSPNSSAAAQFRSTLNQQLQSGYSSPVRTPTVSTGLDPSLSMAAAMMNSRTSAFAKRSQSFSERALMNRYPGLGTAAAATMTTTTTSPSTVNMLSDWGSPSGKLDWGIQGEELQKMRRSATFAIRGNGNSGTAPATMEPVDEPDVSWVQSLVKDGPAAGWSSSNHHQQYRLSSGGAPGDFRTADMMLSPWSEQLFMEQEQLVA